MQGQWPLPFYTDVYYELIDVYDKFLCWSKGKMKVEAFTKIVTVLCYV